MPEDVGDSRHVWLNRNLDDAIDGLEIYSADRHIRTLQPTSVRDLRRAGGPRKHDNLGTMTLVEQDGVLRWVDGLGFRQPSDAARRRGRRGPGRAGNIIKQLKFERLAQNDVGSALRRLDNKLNGTSGLRAWKSPDAGAPAEPVAKGRILLVVHGTFSKTEAITDAFAATKYGKRFFARANKRYDQILSFDHPTISLPPVLNAVDLTRLFAATEATVDVICHSRGGLVVRWWVEGLNQNPKRIGKVVFVGSPLAGTSLAAPPRVRAGLDLLTNVAEVLGKGSQLAATAMPLFVAVTGILKVFGSITKVMAKMPLIDATISMIPGLAAQSYTGDNASILKLREGIGGLPPQPYYAVSTTFEPTSPGWAFWRYFQKPLQRMAALGADIVFDGENDLVVDTHSMTQLSDALDIPPENVMPALPHTDVVHHINYFHQPEVIAFMEKTLRLG